MGRVSSAGVFIRDPNPYLREFRRKLPKTPNGKVDKCDRGLNLAFPVLKFRAMPLCHWWGQKSIGVRSGDHGGHETLK